MTDFYKNNDEQIRSKLTQHEFEPMSGAWDNMSKLLDQQQVVPKRAAAWWWSMPLVAAAALTGIIVVGFNGNKEDIPQNTLTAYNSTVQTISENKNSSIGTTTTIQAQKTDVQTTSISSTNDVVSAKATGTAAVVTTNKAKKTSKKAKAKTKTTVVKTNNNTIVDNGNNSTQNSLEERSNQNTVTVDNNDNSDFNNLEDAEFSTKKVKTTRTIVRYQYSITPLRALQEKRKGITEPITTIGTFGIGNDIENKKSPIKVGVFGGVSTKVYGQNNKLSMMPFGGVTASYKVAPRHAIQTGIQYKGIGQLTNSTESEILSLINTQASAMSASNAYSLTRVDMLEIPLVYQFYPHQNCNIQAGVKAAYLFNVETNNPGFNDKTNDELGIANFDFGLILGIEYCFNKHWSMALQYSLGFVNLTAKAQQKQDEAFALETAAGYDVPRKMDALSSDGELIVPVSNNHNHQELLRLPNQLHNNDLQLLLKYTF